MFCRWLIRGLTLTLLALCVLAWVGSRWQTVGVRYFVRDFTYAVELEQGCVSAGHDNYHFLLFGQEHDGWDFFHRPAALPTGFFGGFGFVSWKSFPLSFWRVTVPLWFPTLLSALLLWFVWRKTGAKPIGGAFPVEITATKPGGDVGRPTDSIPGFGSQKQENVKQESSR
jgi:hypothetical protein